MINDFTQFNERLPAENAYYKQIKGLLDQGLGGLLKKTLTGEGMSLMKIEGQGRVYLADIGKKIMLLRLDGESIFVNGNDVLALESTISRVIGDCCAPLPAARMMPLSEDEPPFIAL